MKCMLLLTSYQIVIFSANIPFLEGTQRNLDTPRRKPPTVIKKNDFCELQEQVEIGNIDLRNSLRNLKIVIGAQDYVVDRATRKVNENYIAVQVLDEVSKRAGFNWRDTVEVVDPPSQNQTWSDVLHSTTRNHDLALDYWYRTIDRVASGLSFPQE